MDKPKLTELVDSYILQEMQELFISKSGIATGISNYDGEYLTDACELSDFCEKCIKQSPEGKRRCDACDCSNAENALKYGKAMAYRCHAGLLDFTAPISVDGELFGFIVGGQICDERPSRDRIARLAKELDIDEEKLYEASLKLEEVPEEKVNEAIETVDKISRIISDIAKNKYAVMQTNTELEALTKLKSDFLANMSHEIRTPMNAIVGMADMALREELTHDARSYISQIKRSSRTLLAIINDILDFSKIESGKMDITMVEYSPIKIIDDVVNIIKTRTKDKNLELIVDIGGDLPGELMGDDVRIKQIITNLANNAVKFTPSGSVKISAQCEMKGPMQYELKIAVKDTGIGIKKEELGKIFESFQQADSKRNRQIEGTGLGLAISQRLLELMGGTINVESEYEKGSTFTITVPQLAMRQVEAEKVKCTDDIKAAIFVKNDYVREQLEKDIHNLGGECVIIEDEIALFDVFTGDLRYLFIDASRISTTAMDKIRDNPDITVVALESFDENHSYELSNIILVKKPLYRYNLIKLFNHEDVNTGADEDEVVDVDFVAPDAEVLVVDDNEVNLTVALGLMRPMRMKIDTAISGKMAVDMIEQKHYDLIFMDHMMPQMDGVETTHIIRRFYPSYDNVPIIALTANAMEQAKGMFLVEGMNDFLPKPVELTLLIDMLKKWLPADKIQMLSREEIENNKKYKDKEISIPGLDVKKAISLVGSSSTYMNVLNNYYKCIPKTKSIILQSYINAQWEEYTINVHALKSSSRQIGATKLGDMAEELEMAAKGGDIEYINKNTMPMLEEYEHIEILLSGYITSEDENVEKQAKDKDALIAVMDEITEALDNLDSTTLEECVDRLKKYQLSEEEEDLLDRLCTACDELDMDACEEVVKSWKRLI